MSVEPVTSHVTSGPASVKHPPVIDSPPFRGELAATATEPPVIDSVSLLPIVRLLTDNASPAWMGIVASEGGSMTSLSAGPVPLPVLQLEASSQWPSPELIHSTPPG